MQVTASKKQIWTAGSYSLLTLSIMVGFMYLNAFATEVLKIPASTLATVLLIAKSIDFIVSMFGGVIIEKVKMGNKGKYQGWLNVGRWILFICIAVEVFPTAGPVWLRCLIMAAGYTVLNSLMNLIQTAYYGIIGIVAGPNPANRSAMTVNMTRQGTVVTLITSFIPTLVSKLQFGQWNYFIVALVFALPMPFALGAIAKMADGKDQPIVKGGAAAGAPRITIKDMIDCLIHNPMLLVLFLVNVILNIGNNILSNQNVYYWLYVAGDFSKMTVNSLFMAFVAFFAAIIMPKLGAKLGKRGAMCFGYIWSAVSFFLRWYVARFGWVWMMISNAVAAVGMYTYMPYAMLLWMDVGEWYLHKTGKDTRGICMGLASPPMKIGMAVGGTIGLKLLASSGYVAGFTPDAAWVTKFMNGAYLVPAICVTISAVIFILFYRISDADATRYAQENAAKMAAQKQQ